jgi:hypothetical protein
VFILKEFCPIADKKVKKEIEDSLDNSGKKFKGAYVISPRVINEAYHIKYQ